jgi:hypothetical protein
MCGPFETEEEWQERQERILRDFHKIMMLRYERAEARMQPGFPASDDFERWKGRRKHLADIEFLNQNARGK